MQHAEILAQKGELLLLDQQWTDAVSLNKKALTTLNEHGNIVATIIRLRALCGTALAAQQTSDHVATQTALSHLFSEIPVDLTDKNIIRFLPPYFAHCLMLQADALLAENNSDELAIHHHLGATVLNVLQDIRPLSLAEQRIHRYFQNQL